MRARVVAGADFSGAKTQPNDTWLAVGHAGEGTIEIADVRKVGSHALAAEVSKLQGLWALGLDFPFSLPMEFMRFLAMKQLKKDFQSWQELAQSVAFMTLDDFIELIKEFKKEPKRYTDKNANVPAQSPLHRGNPSMVQMTYAGMRLLAQLPPDRFAILPFDSSDETRCAVLEVYPRAMLKCFHLPDTGYKSTEKSEQQRVKTAREKIIDELANLHARHGISMKQFPAIAISKKIQAMLIETDHALDAVLACYAAGMWRIVPNLFTDPFQSDSLDVLLEGWIYYPESP